MTMSWVRRCRWMQRVIPPRDEAMRVDRWLRQAFPGLPQSLLQRQLRERRIRLHLASPAPSAADSEVSASPSSRPARAHDLVQSGMTIAIDAVVFERTLRSLLPSDGDLRTPSSSSEIASLQCREMVETLTERIVYLDANYVLLNKPHGLAVQDGSGLHPQASLASYLHDLGRAVASVPSQAEPLRLVHRLDKETSGLLVLARHRLAAARFSELLRRTDVHKTYDALVHAPRSPTAIPRHGVIKTPIGGKLALTLYRRRDDTPHTVGTQWLELEPRTGRKHQLRIHCAEHLRAPIIGDHRHTFPRGDRSVAPVWPEGLARRLYLHARRMRFLDPFARGERRIDVSCEMDDVAMGSLTKSHSH